MKVSSQISTRHVPGSARLVQCVSTCSMPGGLSLLIPQSAVSACAAPTDGHTRPPFRLDILVRSSLVPFGGSETRVGGDCGRGWERGRQRTGARERQGCAATRPTLGPHLAGCPKAGLAVRSGGNNAWLSVVGRRRVSRRQITRNVSLDGATRIQQKFHGIGQYVQSTRRNGR